jgi:hypothetical protein
MGGKSKNESYGQKKGQDKEMKCETETGKAREKGKIGKRKSQKKRVNAIMLDWERGDPPGLPPLSVRSLVVLRGEFPFLSELFQNWDSALEATYLLSQDVASDQ